MVNSIYSNTDTWYSKTKNSTVDSIVIAATAKQSNKVTNSGTAQESSDSSDTSDSSSSSSKKLSDEEFMNMMKYGKKPITLSSNESEEEDDDSISEYDTDGDGSLSTDEYEAMMSQMNAKNAMSASDFFTKYDTDGDGEISSEEMSAVKKDAASKMRPMGPPPKDTKEDGIPSEYDTDGDGSLSTDEYEAMMSQMNVNNAMSAEDFFTKYDTDGNGEISSDEMEAVKKTAADSTSSVKQASDTQKEELASLSDIDTDGDGSISLDELETLAYNTLKAYESNYDYTFENMEGSSLNSIA